MRNFHRLLGAYLTLPTSLHLCMKGAGSFLSMLLLATFLACEWPPNTAQVWLTSGDSYEGAKVYLDNKFQGQIRRDQVLNFHASHDKHIIKIVFDRGATYFLKVDYRSGGKNHYIDASDFKPNPPYPTP